MKIESSGIAHTAEEWDVLAEDEAGFATYPAFTTLIQGDDYYYSCGMKNFGLRDSSVSLQLSPTEAADLLTVFNRYCVFETPKILSDQTFSTAPEEPFFRISERSYEGYAEDDCLFNPFGRWHLEPQSAV